MAAFLILWAMMLILLDASVADCLYMSLHSQGPSSLVFPKDDNGLFQYGTLIVSSVRDREISSHVRMNSCYSHT